MPTVFDFEVLKHFKEFSPLSEIDLILKKIKKKLYA
jgi:hypothetical protein